MSAIDNGEKGGEEEGMWQGNMETCYQGRSWCTMAQNFPWPFIWCHRWNDTQVGLEGVTFGGVVTSTLGGVTNGF